VGNLGEGVEVGETAVKTCTDMKTLHCKKRLAILPSQAGMSLTTNRLGTGKSLTFFYSVGGGGTENIRKGISCRSGRGRVSISIFCMQIAELLF
jgi:hypothetical protein